MHCGFEDVSAGHNTFDDDCVTSLCEFDMNVSGLQKKFLVLIVLAVTIILTLILFKFVEPTLRQYVEKMFSSMDKQMSDTAVILFDNLIPIVKILLWMILVVASVRFLNVLIFSTVLSSSQYEVSNLLRNVISIIVFIVAFFVLLQTQYSTAYEKLTPIFTGSTIIAVVLGLALQDTLGNLFAGLAMQADQPFQAGDVLSIPNKGIGVVEDISWRGVKIRTFQNKLLIISNSVLGKEVIEVAPCENLNARLVFFNTLYANSPSKTIQTIREAVRQVENVSQKIRPVVRVRNLGDNGIDWEVKYWIEDYAKHNETDALIRQRIWYVFQREQIEFAYPTRTLHIETKPQENVFVETDNAIFERLNATSIFSPLNDEEVEMLASVSVIRVFAPGEKIVHAGQKGHSMFVIHRGSVFIQIREDGLPKKIKALHEGEFFGEMGLFTGEPRTATVIAEEETEVLEINHLCIKPILESNPELVEIFGKLIEERRTLLHEQQDDIKTVKQNNTGGVFVSIKKFFGL